MIDIINQRTNVSIRMDYRGPYLISDVNFDMIIAKHTTSTYFKQIGETLIGRKWGTRIIKIAGYLVGDAALSLNERRTLVEVMFNLNDDIKVVYDNKFIIGAPRTTVQWGKTEEENNDLWCKFYVELQCSDPLFKSVQLQKFDLSNWTPNLEFPLEIPNDNAVNPAQKYPVGVEFEKLSQNAMKAITVGGHKETPIIVQFVIRGNLSNPSFVNVQTQEFIKVNYDLVDGDVVTIDTESRDGRQIILVRDNVEINLFKERDKDSKLDMVLFPGINYVLLAADSGVEFLGGNISFYNRFIGVNWQC